MFSTVQPQPFTTSIPRNDDIVKPQGPQSLSETSRTVSAQSNNVRELQRQINRDRGWLC